MAAGFCEGFAAAEGVSHPPYGAGGATLVHLHGSRGLSSATDRRRAAGAGVERFDLMGEDTGAAAAMWLSVASEAEIGCVVIAAPDGLPDEAFREIKRPVLVFCGTKDASDAGDRYRTLLPDCHFMFVYDAGLAIGDGRPEAFAFIVHEFFERRDLFLISRENDVVFP